MVAFAFDRRREHIAPLWYLWGAVLLVLSWRFRHPQLMNRWEPLDATRKMWAIVAVAIFVLCFMPVPATDPPEPHRIHERLVGIDVRDHGCAGNFLGHAEIQAARQSLRQRRALRRLQNKLKAIFLPQARQAAPRPAPVSSHLDFQTERNNRRARATNVSRSQSCGPGSERSPAP